MKVGESLRLTCPVEADPSTIVEWEKDGEAIHMGWERFTKRSNDYVLMIKNLEKSDSGIYRCKAVNGFGSVPFQYVISVYSPSEYSNHQRICVWSRQEIPACTPTAIIHWVIL